MSVVKTLSVVIPVYFNQDSIPRLFETLTKFEHDLENVGGNLQLIFVNDGSRDKSLERLLEVKRKRPDTIVVNHLSNRGSMAAIRTGLKFVRGDCFSFISADLQDPPDILISMFVKWQAGNRFVVAARSSREDPFMTKFFAAINYRMVRLFVFKNYPKGGFDVALMDRAFLGALSNCGYNKNLGMQAWALGVPADIIYYHRSLREEGRSMWTFRKKVNYFLDSTIGFSVSPIRFLTVGGFILAFICFMYSAFVVVGRLTGSISTPGFAALASAIGFLHGCGFVMIGVHAEYTWRIYSEKQQEDATLFEEV